MAGLGCWMAVPGVFSMVSVFMVCWNLVFHVLQYICFACCLTMSF